MESRGCLVRVVRVLGPVGRDLVVVQARTVIVERWCVPDGGCPGRELGDRLDVVLGFDSGAVGRCGEGEWGGVRESWQEGSLWVGQVWSCLLHLVR